MNRKTFLLLTLLSLTLNIAGQKLTEQIPGSDVSFELVLIPSDIFMVYNSPIFTSNGYPHEIPKHLVKLDSFWIGVHEVTYDEFIIFYQKEYDTNASNHPSKNYSADAISRPTPQYIDYTYGMGKSGFPAVSMTQQAALRYCKWLYGKTGNFYRLPTEAEWEIACRGGGQTEYPPSGANLSEYAWSYENAFEKYHEVGQKRPNLIGLFDMLGNVAEWTLDQNQEYYYLHNLDDEIKITENNGIKIQRLPRYPGVVRGGSYDSDAEDCRCQARQKSSPRWQARDPQIPKSKWWNPDSPFVGFRLVRPTKKMTPTEVEAFFKLAIKD